MSGRASFCAILITLAAVLVLPIMELVIGARHLGDQECANGKVVTPATWLVVTGAVTLGGVAASIWILIEAVMTGSDPAGGVFLMRCVSAVFTIIWSIIGAVSLWRDNIACPAGELHDMIWASVIIHFISTVLLMCGGKQTVI